MKASFKYLLGLLLVLALCIPVFKGGVISEVSDVSAEDVDGQSAETSNQLLIPFRLKLSDAVAGVEFKLTDSSGLTFVSLEKSESIDAASLTPVVTKDGVIHFGFYSAENGFRPDASGFLDVGWLALDYSGTGRQSITISEARTVEVIDKDSTYAKTYPLRTTIWIPDNLSEPLVLDLTNSAIPEETDPQQPFRFDDVQDEETYFFAPVYWAYDHAPQITTGTSERLFSPDAGCTRAQAVTFLWRAAGEPAAQTDDTPFEDVPADGYYAKAVAWAVEQGITKGTSENRFSPDSTCTRAQIVTFLWRFSGSPEAKNIASFADVKAGDYYEAAVAWAVEQGITKGTSETKFSPDSTCTRGQIVTFLYRALA